MNKKEQLLVNIELLKQHGYDETLLDYPVLDLEKNKEGYANLRYSIADGKKTYLHSQYNIEREWQSVAKELYLKKDAIYFVYGLGLGHHIKALKEKISSRSYIYVIEKSPEIISTYFHTQDFSEIALGNIFFFFGTEEEILTKINQKLFAFNIMPLFGNLTNFILSSYHQIYGSWIEKMQTKIFDAIRHAYFMLGNDMEDTVIGIKNNLENINILLESTSIELLKDSYSNLPVIIVAAGPSLDKNIHQLKKAQGKALIIATDAVLSTLRKHDIVPNGVVSIERGLLTYEKFYKDKEIHPQTVFIGPPVVRPEIFAAMQDHKKLLCLKEGENINEWINDDILEENRLLQMGTSCAHIAFSFAKHVGADPIVFIGQDLAYTKEGVTHSNEVEIKDKIDPAKQEEMAFVKGMNGELLPTSNAFKQFLTWYELQIAADNGTREYIDATEGGAYINGTKIMTLQKVIDKYCMDTIPLLYDLIPNNTKIEEKYEKAFFEVKNLIEVFEKIKDEANRHILRLDKLGKKVIRDKKEFSFQAKEKIYKVLNQGKNIENLILQHDIARTLFQAPFMMAATKVRMLGNEESTENIKDNVLIQKRMVGAFIIGCHLVLGTLREIIEKMKNERG